MKVTRRELAISLAGAAALAADAQTTPADPTVAARDAVEKNSQALAKFAIPMSTEPAFQFKA